MSSILPLYLGLTGLAVGSFLNLVADRLPHGESIVWRSHCPHCGRELSALDLVPVLNYLWLRGRCRTCHAPIPIRLPVVELGTGVLFLVVASSMGPTLAMATTLIYLSLLIVISIIDLNERLILNKLVFPGMVLALLLFPLTSSTDTAILLAWTQSLAGGILAFSLFLVIHLVSRGGMGAGDVKLAGLIGLMTGFPLALVALFSALVAGGTLGALLLLLGRRNRKDTMPFGPFLALGAGIALLAGPMVLAWYLGLLGVVP